MQGDMPSGATGAAVTGTGELTDAERCAFRERGYFVREAIFGEAELSRLRAAVEDIHRRISAAASAEVEVERVDGLRFQDILGSRVKWEWRESMSGDIRSMEPVHHLSDTVDALIDDARLCAPVRDLLNETGVSLFTDKLNFKRPGGAPFPWHQDAPYWAFGCRHVDRLVSVQIYLDDATEENGCLWMIPGSHTRGHIPAPTDRGDDTLARLYTDVAQLEDLQKIAVVAPAGSALFFDSYLVHGSKSNRSSQSRRALVLTYQPPELPVRDTDTVRVPRAGRVGLAGLVRRFRRLLGGAG